MKYFTLFILGFVLAWLLKPTPKPVYVETVTTDTLFAWRDTCLQKTQPKKPVVMKKRPKSTYSLKSSRTEWVIPGEFATAESWYNEITVAMPKEQQEDIILEDEINEPTRNDTLAREYAFTTETIHGTIHSKIVVGGMLYGYQPTFTPKEPIGIKFDVPVLSVPDEKNAVGILTGIQANKNTFSPVVGVGYARNNWNVGYVYLPNIGGHQIQGGVFVKF